MKLAALGHAPLEREVEQGLIRLFVSVGGKPYRTSQGYRAQPGGTRMTPGLPDFVVFFPRIGKVLFFEAKRPGGKLRPSQEQFAADCLESGQAFAWGGAQEVIAVLQQWGLVR